VAKIYSTNPGHHEAIRAKYAFYLLQTTLQLTECPPLAQHT